MTLKEFLYCAASTVEIVEGPDSNYATVMIIPSEGIDETNDHIAPEFLNREVCLFSAKAEDIITVYLEKEGAV